MKKLLITLLVAPIILFASCNNDATNENIVVPDVSQALKSVSSSEEISEIFATFTTEQEFITAIHILEENNLSHLMEKAHLGSEKYELVTLPTGVTITKTEDKYYLDDDILLTEKQVAILSDPTLSQEPIVLSQTNTQEDLCAMMAKKYPEIVLPNYETIKKVVDQHSSSSNQNILTRGAALIGITFLDLWDKKKIPYTFHGDLSTTQRNIILQAIAHWNSYSGKTGITIEPRTDQKDYIEFILGNGNSSPLGKKGNKQNITLYKNGFSAGTVIHEIGHSIGLYHEQCKKNRDNFIVVHGANILGGKEHNFRKQDVNCAQFDAFDFGSIMLYSSYDFSSNGNPTMTKKSDGSTWNAQRIALSNDDINIIPKMYELSYIATYIYLLNGGK